MAGNILFGIYLLGIAVGLWTAWVLKSTVLGSDSEPFVMELPPYRWPTIGSVIFQAKAKALMYVKKAGTLILAAVVLIWVAGNYPKNPELDGAFALRISEIQGDSGLLPAEKERLSGELGRMLRSDQLAYSFAGRAGMFMEPVLRPIGFDWRIGIALVTGLAAKEVVVSTMATIYALSAEEGSADLKTTLQRDPAFNRATALSLMVFVLLYLPCMAALGVMKKEVGRWKPVLLYSVYSLTIAWVMSFIVYRTALLIL